MLGTRSDPRSVTILAQDAQDALCSTQRVQGVPPRRLVPTMAAQQDYKKRSKPPDGADYKLIGVDGADYWYCEWCYKFVNDEGHLLSKEHNRKLSNRNLQQNVPFVSAAYPQLALPNPWGLQQQLALPSPSWGLQRPPGPVVAGFAAAGVADDGPVGPQLELPPPPPLGGFAVHPIAHAKAAGPLSPPPTPPFPPAWPPPPPSPPPRAGPVVNEDPPGPPQNTHAERLDMMDGRMLRLDNLVCQLVQANMDLVEKVANIEQGVHEQIVAVAVVGRTASEAPPSVPAGVLGASDTGTVAAVAPEPAAAPSSSSQPQGDTWQSQPWEDTYAYVDDDGAAWAAWEWEAWGWIAYDDDHGADGEASPCNPS